MYLIARYTTVNTTDFFGPFPNKDRASEYAKAFDEGIFYDIYPIIVPNCVTISLKY